MKYTIKKFISDNFVYPDNVKVELNKYGFILDCRLSTINLKKNIGSSFRIDMLRNDRSITWLIIEDYCMEFCRYPEYELSKRILGLVPSIYCKNIPRILDIRLISNDSNLFFNITLGFEGYPNTWYDIPYDISDDDLKLFLQYSFEFFIHNRRKSLYFPY